MLGRKYQALELSKIIGDTKSKVHFNSYNTNVSIDSRSSINDNHTLFFPIRGKRFDGHDYILNAIQQSYPWF